MNQPFLVLDDFFPDPMAVRASGLRHFFFSDQQEPMLSTMLPMSGAIVNKLAAVGVLQLGQLISGGAHYIGSYGGEFTVHGKSGYQMLVCLTPAASGSTVFHRPTGEMILVENVFNRAVVWDGRRLPVAVVPFGHNEETARLVQLCTFDVHQVQPETPERTTP